MSLRTTLATSVKKAIGLQGRDRGAGPLGPERLPEAHPLHVEPAPPPAPRERDRRA